LVYFVEDLHDQTSTTVAITSKHKRRQLKLAWTLGAQALYVGGTITGWTSQYRKPEYFAPDIFVFPVDSPVLVRESELSSIISLTLSAKPFIDEVIYPWQILDSLHHLAKSRRQFANPSYPAPSRQASRAPIPSDLFTPTTERSIPHHLSLSSLLSLHRTPLHPLNPPQRC